ncbi:Fe-S cluster assembly protein SufB [Acidiferrimicrobium sp. IK]|uniref:Fe-S cluster assembly protein SufB n=1 Tax=Acidiferrimicrobium sp. IK TaxID=2871700 RepID=UPI0021CB39F8|nr:Fe-S cluster assembly protein SufB [Acidiferrimicrobium sp. IK]MCU4182989.1 Fe-S cluster assembly protein SufB [Acidiferrimicrobium sp. IK]
MSGAPLDLEELAGRSYAYGFVTDLDTDLAPKGLNEEVIGMISAKKEEPDWLLDWRLRAYRHWRTMSEPVWQNVRFDPIDYDDIIYYAAPKTKEALSSLDEVDPEIRAMFDKLGISLAEQERLSGVAIDAVVDSVSVATTFQAKLAEAGVVFCSFSEAVRRYPELVRPHLGSVVSYRDNFFAALNSAVFTDGSFCYVPKGVRCPMELSTYFRINAAGTGQFERTLIVVEDGAEVSYLEGCTAPMRDENQLHAAVVELVAMEGAKIKYSTVQNWYPGDAEGRGGIYNFVTKRGLCTGARSKISWTQVETGSAITWKYPGVVLKGDESVGEFYSVALSANHQQADTGTKMIHIGRDTKSTIVSKAISAGHGQNTYRGLVKMLRSAEGARNHTRCDSLLIGPDCGAHTFPYIEVKHPTARAEHEASTSKVSEDQLFYARQRGIPEEEATSMIVNGFCREVFKELPMEFAVEAQRLLSVSLEGAVG